MGIFDNGTGNLGLGSAWNDIKNTFNSAFHIGSAGNPISDVGVPVQDSNLPWSGNTPVNSKFFKYIPIDTLRWNQLFPYRLIVVDVSKNPAAPVNGSGPIQVTAYQEGTIILAMPDVVKTGVVQGNWIFTLPITPQQLTITDQYAINTSATLRGVIEEHNGVKFKMINASGTMGVWPYRSKVANTNQSPSILQSLFGGTLTAVNSLINQVATTVNTFTTNNPNNKPKTIEPGSDSGYPFASTGYYFAMAFQQFLEQYAEAKKNPANAGWRLVFDIPKQNTSYVVTPMQFNWRQDANKPMEIQYQLQFKAWRRIDLKSPLTVAPLTSYTITPGILQRILNTITEAQLTMSSATAVIGAVTSDVNNIFQVISGTSLFVKDLLGVATAASDLPTSIVKDFNSAIGTWVFTNPQTAAAGVRTASGAAAVAAIVASQTNNNGLTPTAVSNGQLGTNAAQLQQTSQVANIFNNPNANIDLLQQVPNDQLNLNTAQQNKLNNILSNTTLTVSQLKQNAATIQNLSTLLADYFGAGSSLYNSIYGITPPPVSVSQMTIDQFLLLDTLYEFIQSLSILTATTQITNNEIQNSLDYVAGLANQSNIPFDVSTSKIIVPVPANTTIEGIAARYLGDANRWLEIVTLNQLQEPYLDYSGFQLPLVSNAIGRQVVVSSNQNLYIGQTVTLVGAGQIQVSRHITTITALPNGNDYLITLDGEPNLNNFTTSNSSYIQCYLPGTVNAMQKIYIPSDLPVAQLEGQVNVTLPEIVSNSGDPLAQISGVDFLLDDSGDLILTKTGDFQLAYGLNAIIQWLRILFSTTLNSFLIHPEFGLGILPGTSVSDLNIQDLYSQINTQIQNDPRFSGITSLQIQATPPTLSISVAVQIQGQTGIFPVSFELAAA